MPGIDGEFTVLAGSRVVPSWSDRGSAESTRRAYASYRERHARPANRRITEGANSNKRCSPGLAAR